MATAVKWLQYTKHLSLSLSLSYHIILFIHWQNLMYAAIYIVIQWSSVFDLWSVLIVVWVMCTSCKSDMMGLWTKWIVLTVILAYFQIAAGVELTFELLDNAKDCFYEDIKLNTSVSLEFQVWDHTLILKYFKISIVYTSRLVNVNWDKYVLSLPVGKAYTCPGLSRKEFSWFLVAYIILFKTRITLVDNN